MSCRQRFPWWCLQSNFRLTLVPCLPSSVFLKEHIIIESFVPFQCCACVIVASGATSLKRWTVVFSFPKIGRTCRSNAMLFNFKRSSCANVHQHFSLIFFHICHVCVISPSSGGHLGYPVVTLCSLLRATRKSRSIVQTSFSTCRWTIVRDFPFSCLVTICPSIGVHGFEFVPPVHHLQRHEHDIRGSHQTVWSRSVVFFVALLIGGPSVEYKCGAAASIDPFCPMLVLVWCLLVRHASFDAYWGDQNTRQHMSTVEKPKADWINIETVFGYVQDSASHVATTRAPHRYWSSSRVGTDFCVSVRTEVYFIRWIDLT